MKVLSVFSYETDWSPEIIKTIYSGKAAARLAFSTIHSSCFSGIIIITTIITVITIIISIIKIISI